MEVVTVVVYPKARLLPPLLKMTTVLAVVRTSFSSSPPVMEVVAGPPLQYLVRRNRPSPYHHRRTNSNSNGIPASLMNKIQRKEKIKSKSKFRIQIIFYPLCLLPHFNIARKAPSICKVAPTFFSLGSISTHSNRRWCHCFLSYIRFAIAEPSSATIIVTDSIETRDYRPVRSPLPKPTIDRGSEGKKQWDGGSVRRRCWATSH